MSCPVGFGPLFLLGERLKTFRPVNWQESIDLEVCATKMDPRAVAERVRKIAEQTAIDHGVELVHAEVAGPEGQPIVRLFIDKPGGVTHDDCSKVSHQMSTVLDVEDFIHSAYVLEVSSPGLERGLYKGADYERFAGSMAKIKARSPIKGQRNFRGRILGVANDHVAVEDRTSGRVEIPLDGIVKANLEADVESELRARRDEK
jgi:ribosome maturation factor RimP